MSVISVKDVKKKFRVYYDKGSSLKEKYYFKVAIAMKTVWF